MEKKEQLPRVYPFITTIQKIALYETKTRFYIVGSNNTQTKFRVLKIDRTEPRELIICDDRVEYNQKEIRELLTMIDIGNRSKQAQKNFSGLSRTVSAFGIVGFVKFLEGYYIILITKRRRIAVVGYHAIYKIEDTSMFYIPNTGERNVQPEETRYVKTFQNIDLSSNFYYSYSYDLTHTLQYNLSPLRSQLDISSDEEAEPGRSAPYWNPQLHLEEGSIECADNFLASLQPTGEDYLRVQSKYQDKSYTDDTFSSDSPEIWSELKPNKQLYGPDADEVCYGIRNTPRSKFVWNSELLSPADVHPDWLLFITHGFVGQSNLTVYGKPVYVTLIARRSNKFAGTRFLKRGANQVGDVANEVETEQIVHDSSVSSLLKGHFTAFVQLRGSIPFHWSQDTSKMVPKPAISLDMADPYCYTAGRHFNQLLCRYGSPILVLNLVKKRETKKHESLLSDEFIKIIHYLNQFLPPQHQIVHIGLDMARINNLKEANVMSHLSDIAYYVVRRLGIFQSWSPFACHEMRPHPLYARLKGYKDKSGSILQTGVLRVNCVDCLDRTNTAQFALGKVALAFQLYALGVLERPLLEFDTDSVRMLEELYEDHGDTLALQYGGSQLVHRIKTYRKISPLSSHSRDIMQTLSRYYSNTFSDADKQNAINLFLGVYKAYSSAIPLWDLPTDYYLHNPVAIGKAHKRKNPYTQWWDDEVAECLPLSVDEAKKGLGDSLLQISKIHRFDEKIDGYFERYRPYELTVLNELFSFNLSNSVRDFMPNFATDYSPFSVRVRPGKRRESMGTDKPPNPSVCGTSSTTSTSSSTSETDDEDSSEEDVKFLMQDSQGSSSSDDSSLAAARPLTFQTQFQTMRQVYGTEIRDPDDLDTKLYRKFVGISKMSSAPLSTTNEARTPSKSITLIRQSALSLDTSHHVAPPTVQRTDRDIYQDFVDRGKLGASSPSQQCLLLYKRYVASKFQ